MAFECEGEPLKIIRGGGCFYGPLILVPPLNQLSPNPHATFCPLNRTDRSTSSNLNYNLSRLMVWKLSAGRREAVKVSALRSQAVWLPPPFF